jgi:hypothetical protein
MFGIEVAFDRSIKPGRRCRHDLGDQVRRSLYVLFAYDLPSLAADKENVGHDQRATRQYDAAGAQQEATIFFAHPTVERVEKLVE